MLPTLSGECLDKVRYFTLREHRRMKEVLAPLPALGHG